MKEVIQRTYYRPAPQMDSEIRSGPAIESPAVTGLFNACVRKQLIDKPNTKGERVQFFTDGLPPSFPSGTEKEIFIEESKQIIRFYTQDILDTNGNIPPGKSQEFKNMLEIAPELVRILTNSESHISFAQRSQSLNILGAALHLSRHPNTELAISMGIGGSDSDMTSARFPAYVIPAAKIIEELNEFYEKRRKNKLTSELAEKMVIEEFTNLPDDDPDIKARKKARKKELFESIESGKINPEDYFSDTQTQEIHNRHAIRVNRPRLRVFFAHQAAIAINHTMDSTKIPNRTQENMNALRIYMTTFHPKIAPHMELIVDTPWKEHSPYQTVLIEYLAYELRESQDLNIQKTLAVLRKLGGNHGGEMGAERAAEYAAAHPAVFGDRMNLPYTMYLEGENKNPAINITIGGKTEREFCAVREYLTRIVNAKRLKTFIANKALSASDSKQKQRLQGMIASISRWEDMIAQRRNRYGNIGDEGVIAKADLPIHGIQLITTIGQTPTYYPTEYDIPTGTSDSDVAQHAADLDALNERLKVQGSTLDRSRLKNVRTDYQIMAEDMRIVTKAGVTLEEGKEVYI